jgi:hypothetical protein
MTPPTSEPEGMQGVPNAPMPTGYTPPAAPPAGPGQGPPEGMLGVPGAPPVTGYRGYEEPQAPSQLPAVRPTAQPQQAQPQAQAPNGKVYRVPDSTKPGGFRDITVTYGQGAGGQGNADPNRESNEHRAWRAFPGGSPRQRALYGQYLKYLDSQDRREAENARNRAARGNPDERVRVQEEGRDRRQAEMLDFRRASEQEKTNRANQLAETRRFQTLVSSDNATLRAILQHTDNQTRAFISDLNMRRRDFAKNDPKGIAGEAMPLTDDEKAVLGRIAKNWMSDGLISPQDYVPGGGWTRSRGDTAPAPEPAPAPAPKAAPAPTQQPAPYTQDYNGKKYISDGKGWKLAPGQ